MKLTKSQLKQLIKEEFETIQELETNGENGVPEKPARPERAQAATASKATSLRSRERATEKVTDPVAAAQLLFKQLQGFSAEIDKAATMRNLITLIKQSS